MIKLKFFVYHHGNCIRLSQKRTFFFKCTFFSRNKYENFKKYLPHIKTIMKHKNSVLLQFYEYDNKVKNTVNPR